MARTLAIRLSTLVLTLLAALSAARAAADTGVGTWSWDAPVAVPAADIPLSPGPPRQDHGDAIRYAKRHPGSVPEGVNDFGCLPSPAHPLPVILAHGTDSNAYSDWAGLAPLLVRAGYCVFAPNYGGAPAGATYGVADMRLGMHQLARFVDQVLAVTGAPKVDVVGFSQGATIARGYINKLGGAPKVNQWIGLASPSYGGVFYGLVPLMRAVPGLARAVGQLAPPAIMQQMAGSALLTALNAGGDTVPGVRYTTIGTTVDEMIQPHTNVALRSPDARNIVIQDLCPIDLTGHFNMPYDPFAQQLVLAALDAAAPSPVCRAVPLGTGILSVILAAHS
jgi:triacylglycerol esterase/lipase EstA (alpha/beta hydrolase family)